jgi:hypothetical protein
MSIAIQASDRFTSLPDEQTLAETAVALEERGFSGEGQSEPDDCADEDDLDEAGPGARAGNMIHTTRSLSMRST